MCSTASRAGLRKGTSLTKKHESGSVEETSWDDVDKDVAFEDLDARRACIRLHFLPRLLALRLQISYSVNVGVPWLLPSLV